MNVHKLSGETTFWRKRCILQALHGQSNVCIGRATFTVITASAEIRIFILLVLHGAEGREFVFINGRPALT
jgi:hypothetical protein